MEREFSEKELELAKELSYANWEKDETEIGFEFLGQWITNPFVETSGRFEFMDFASMCAFYGKENVCNLLSQLLDNYKGEKQNGDAL